jgi:N utilization substance protein A
MARIKYDIDAMKFMSMFEGMTGAKLKDCIISENMVTFIVEDGEIAKAIGKKGINVRRLESSLKKRVKIAEFNDNLAKFIENIVYPAKVRTVKQEDKIVTLTAADTRSRGLLIGRGASILRGYEAIVKRFFDIEEIKVE